MDLQWSGVMERCHGAMEGSMFGVINGRITTDGEMEDAVKRQWRGKMTTYY